LCRQWRTHQRHRRLAGRNFNAANTICGASSILNWGVPTGFDVSLHWRTQMSSLAILQSLKESIVMANVKAVFGEPIAAQGKTVIPVAKIIYGYSGGGGTGGVGNSGTRSEGGGGG